MATADTETVVPARDLHHQPVEKKTNEEETTNKLVIPSSNEDGNKGEAEFSVKQLKEAPTEDKLPVVTEVDQAPKLEVPAETASKEVEEPVPESEASSVLGSTGRAVEEQPQGKPEAAAAEEVVQERASALEAAEIEADNKVAPEATEIVSEEMPTLKPEENTAMDGVAEETIEKQAGEALEEELEERPDSESESKTKEGVVEGEEKRMLEAVEKEAEEKTESLVVESELEKEPALEVHENQPKKSAEIETSDKCEDEAINPITTNEAADERVQKVEDVPAQESDLEMKNEPEEAPTTQSLEAEVEQTSEKDQVVDAPKGEPQEFKDDTEEVEAKTTEKVAEDEGGKDDKLEDDTIITAPKSAVAETSVPVVKAETDIKEAGVDKFVSETEKTVAEEINNAAHENVAVQEITKEDGKVEEENQVKDAKAEEQTDEMVAKAEELVTTETNNGLDHDVTEGKLKDDNVVPEEKQKNDVKVEQVLEEKNASAESLPLIEVANVEDVGSVNASKEVAVKSFEGEQVSRDLEVAKEEAKELEDEKTGTIEPDIGSKDSPLETKVEETVKDMANESEPTMALTTAEEAKPDPSTLGDSKNIGDDPKAKQELCTTEVVKSTHKSSSNIISKVKQSLVKVKKAITGKSPSFKTASAESKVEDKAK